MRITIDNADGRGPVDYSAHLDTQSARTIRRKLNRPSTLTLSLVAATSAFVVPAARARITVERADGHKLFTGYVTATPDYEYLGWGERGPMYRYTLAALSDEVLLDGRTVLARSMFIQRTAGDIVRQLALDLMPGAFDTGTIEPCATLPSYTSGAQRTWSEHAAEVALLARACYRAQDGKITFSQIAKSCYTLDENAADFCPEGFTLQSPDMLANDLTVVGRVEPASYVKDYFLGDGYTLGFNLSETPFISRTQVLLEDEYEDAALDKRYWSAADPARAISVSGGKLRVDGGNGVDGATNVTFAEQIELGGSLMLQHGDVEFTAASTGILGGLYNGATDTAHCVAGFRVTASGAQSVIAAIVNGAAAGTTITTQAGHRYTLSTRIYASRQYRNGQVFHSSQHPAGAGRGGATNAADLRLMLEVHDVVLSDGGTQASPSIVLYDGLIADAPANCTYAVVNSTNLHAAISYTRIARVTEAQVATTVPGQAARTRLVGSLSEGAQCRVSESAQLRFYPAYVPAANEMIRVSYRAGRRAMARVTDAASVAVLAGGNDDGVRSAVRSVSWPAPRTSEECETAALALLDDSTRAARSGEYRVWSDFLPQRAADLFPGDGLIVNAPSRDASFSAVIREVEVDMADPDNDRSRYVLRFANDAAQPLAFDFDPAHLREPLEPVETTITTGQVFIADLPSAEITGVSSTTLSISTGSAPPAGGGFEVRRSDTGWGQTSDRNLVGRFTAQSFTLPRLSSTQTYYIRQYDAGSPPRYSRFSTLLHVDYPL